VLTALRNQEARLTVIVAFAYDEAPSRGLPGRTAASSIDELRLALDALTGDDSALGRALRRPLEIDGLGRHLLGNLVIASLATAFGDYGRASSWLGEQLGIAGTVLPATSQPVRCEIDEPARPDDAEAASGWGSTAWMLRLVSKPVSSPPAAVEAIVAADWVLLAPGSLVRSVLSVGVVPELRGALRRTSASVLWISNLKAGSSDAAGTSAVGHLLALRRHEIPVNAVLYDPSTDLSLAAEELASFGVSAVPKPLRGSDPARHDPRRLRSALRALIG
jgi:uncharacterized cofD-like protein